MIKHSGEIEKKIYVTYQKYKELYDILCRDAPHPDYPEGEEIYKFVCEKEYKGDILRIEKNLINGFGKPYYLVTHKQGNISSVTIRSRNISSFFSSGFTIRGTSIKFTGTLKRIANSVRFIKDNE